MTSHGNRTRPTPLELPSTTPSRPPRLTRVVWGIAALVLAELMVVAGRYGYHRDELYFIVAGSHPAFGYPDQPPLVPLLTRSLHAVDPSLYLLRLPSALAAAATVVIAAAASREARGGKTAQAIAALVTGVSAISLATGHFVTTTTFDVLSTSLLGWLLIRATVRRDPRPLLWSGLVVGIGFEAKPQVGFVAAVSLAALALAGPRWVFRSWHLWAGVLLAIALSAPYLLWQQQHGWPQLTVARNIAGQAENGRIGFIPFQLIMVSPVLVPIWVAGLVSPLRNPALRAIRFLPILFGLLAAAYLIGDGKAYYLASLYPTLIGVGSVPTAAWLTRGSHHRARVVSLGAAIALSAVTSALVALPVLPERDLPGSAAIALNPDLGETVGWPQFIDTIGSAWDALPATRRKTAVIFTENYGEAGAIDVLGSHDRLPHAFSGHNGFSLWARPKPDETTTIVVGYPSAASVRAYFTGCRIVARVSNPVHLDNDEYGDPVLECSRLTAPWSELWPRLRHFN